jgi:hypothetical protein
MVGKQMRQVRGLPPIDHPAPLAAPVRRQPLVRRAPAARPLAPTIDEVATAAVEGKDAGRPVAAEVRGPVEAHLGHGLAHARIHDDALAREASAAMGARAFAHGADVFLGPGESDRDLGLMAHELTHVAQQDGAAAAAQRKVTVGAADAPAEREADAVAEAITGAARPAALLVDDGPAAPGQMLKSTFLDALRAAVTEAVDAELGPEHSAVGCPYLDYYFGHYVQRPATEAEAFLRRWAPAVTGASTAEGMIAPVVARARAGIQHWRATGEAPPDLPADVRGPAAAAAPRGLGVGAPLDGATASRMMGALGQDLSRVRVHTDAAAARLAADHGAVAVARGPHIAFAPGHYAPGTVEGDAILAHELAHVAQQDGATATDPGAEGATALEDDADQVATGVVARLWGGARRALDSVASRLGPSLRSGLAVQRCGGMKPNLGKTPSLDDLKWYIDASPAIGSYVAGRFEGGLPMKLEYYKHNEYIAHAMKYGRDNDPEFQGLSDADVERKANDTSAFNDKSRNRIVVDESKAQAAATMHEVMHSYCSPAWSKLGWRVSEGGTEYFTRQVAAEAGVKPNGEYEVQVGAVARLIEHSSHDLVATAYFKGDVEGVKLAIDGKHQAGTFDAWVTATNTRNWNADPLASPEQKAAEDKAEAARE